MVQTCTGNERKTHFRSDRQRATPNIYIYKQTNPPRARTRIHRSLVACSRRVKQCITQTRKFGSKFTRYTTIINEHCVCERWLFLMKFWSRNLNCSVRVFWERKKNCTSKTRYIILYYSIYRTVKLIISCRYTYMDI